MLINSRLDFRIIFGLVKEIQLQSNVESYHINKKAAIFRVLSQLTYIQTANKPLLRLYRYWRCWKAVVLRCSLKQIWKIYRKTLVPESLF